MWHSPTFNSCGTNAFIRDEFVTQILTFTRSVAFFLINKSKLVQYFALILIKIHQTYSLPRELEFYLDHPENVRFFCTKNFID